MRLCDYAKISERNDVKKSCCTRCNDCVRFGAESSTVVRDVRERTSFFFCRREEDEEWGRKLGKRVRARTTLYSLVSEFQWQYADGGTIHNENSFKLGSIGIDANLHILSEIIKFFSIRENIFRVRIILLLLSRTSCRQTGPILRFLCAVTIPVLNYHKPLTPARTKLFLHSDPNQLTITPFPILNILFIFVYFVYIRYILKMLQKLQYSFEIPSKNRVKPV